MRHIKKFNEEFDWEEVLKNSRDEKDLDRWSNLEKDLVEVSKKYEGQFGIDSYAIVDAMYQVLDTMFQKK